MGYMASEILECRQRTWSFRSVTVPSIWPPASLLAGLTMSPMNCTQCNTSYATLRHTHTCGLAVNRRPLYSLHS